MKRLVSIVLIFCFAALGSGLLRYAHESTHAAHPEISVATSPAPGNPLEPAPAPPPHPQHDEATCTLHAALNAPLLHAGAVPLLVLLGLFVAFLTLLASPLVSERHLLRLDCRGPPARRS